LDTLTCRHYSMDFLSPERVTDPDEVPIEHLDYSYVQTCSEPKELEAMLALLKVRSAFLSLSDPA
jgi:hypothetical protein